jgi:NADH dehydrogenase
MNHTKPLKVVIVGGGFAGVKTALILSNYSQVQVTLISSAENFFYFPQLYHAATGGIMAESAIPLTKLFAGKSVQLVRDTVTTFDPDKKHVTGASKESYAYDRLILAMGAVTNYFGIQGLEEFSYDIKSPVGADRFKRHLHKQLIEDKKPDVNYVVVGGGPTGVELS